MAKEEGSFKMFFILMLVSILIISFWDKLSFITEPVNSILDPTVGALIAWNLTWGFIIFLAIFSLLTVVIQKYTTNQEKLRKLKAEQKELQNEMKKFSHDKNKLLELQKESFKFVPKMMKLTLRSSMFTLIPFILIYRWIAEILYPAFGAWWIAYYIAGIIIFSSIFRKILKVV